MQHLSPRELRKRIRNGSLRGHTSGQAPGYVQANLVILPEAYAKDFTAFCRANPRPCPLISVSPAAGLTADSRIAEDLDIRTDLPSYLVFEHGVLRQRTENLLSHWRGDLVTFLIGCSFSFEEALTQAGLEIRNVTEGKNVPMYITNQPCTPAGVFASPLVVSMRPMTPEDAEQASAVCKKYPHVHGEPVHIGSPEMLGIGDLNRPDFGDAVTLRPQEVPVFWACGVTPQLAVRQAAPDLCITHAPGHMLITDLKNREQTTFTPPLIP